MENRTMTKTVDAILRGPDPYFAPNGVLYAPGQVVKDVPVDQVSDYDYREEVVDVRGDNGKLRQIKVQRQIKFRPLTGSSAARGEAADGE